MGSDKIKNSEKTGSDFNNYQSETKK